MVGSPGHCGDDPVPDCVQFVAGMAQEQRGYMNSRNLTTAAMLVMLALNCTATLAQSSRLPEGLIHARLGGAVTQRGASQAGMQSQEAPAVSLTWGIITYPGQTNSGAASVNKSGHMVGGYGPMIQTNYANGGFLLKGSKFKAIDYPGANWTQPLAINDSNAVVGAYGPTASSPAQGFMLKGKKYFALNYPGAGLTRPSGINKAGEVVGEAEDTTDHGFLYSKGAFSSIEYPGAAYTVAWSINNGGTIVGYYGLTASDSHGLIYSGGTYTTFDYPGGYSQNVIIDINDSGVIVGAYGDEMTVNGIDYFWEHCYIYESGQFTSCDAPFGPPAVTTPWHFNDYGVITGTYVDNTATTYGFEVAVGP